MKSLLKVLFFASLVLTTATFASCSDDNNNDVINPQEETTSNLEEMKNSIAECNAALNENFNASNFTSFNKVLNRLLDLTLFDDDNLQKIHQDANSRLGSTLVCLDTIDLESVENEDLYYVMVGFAQAGFKYVASFRFDHLHFSYNSTTADWDVDNDYDGGVLIDFPDEDGTTCTLEFTNKSDYFGYPTDMAMMQLLTPANNNTVLYLEMCEEYDVIAKRGNETILSGNAKNWLFDENGEYYSDINVQINDYNVEYRMQDHDADSYYDIDVIISKGGTDLITLNMPHDYAQGEELIFKRTSTWNFFDKIKIVGEHSDARQEASLMIAAAQETNESTINSYLDQLNKLQTLNVYYGTNMEKVANMKWGSGKIFTNKYDVIPLVQLAEGDEYISILHELRLGDISDALTFINSFDNGVLTALMNLFARQGQWIDDQQ